MATVGIKGLSGITDYFMLTQYTSCGKENVSVVDMH